MRTELPSGTRNGDEQHVYYEDTEEFRTEQFLHYCLLDEIREAFNQNDLKRCHELWHCYDVMFNPPVNEWDLEWRRKLGYPL